MSATNLGDPHQIIHTPARDLTGTSETKLTEPDTFLAQPQIARLALCGQPVRLDRFVVDRMRLGRSITDVWIWPMWRPRTILKGGTANA